MTHEMIETKVFSRKLALAVFAIALCAWAGLGLANAQRQMTIDEKMRVSDLVVIGTVEESDIQPEDNRNIRIARVRLEGVSSNRSSQPNLAAGDEIRLVYRTGADETNVDWCCKKGRRYLLFLAEAKKGLYRSANGPFGFYFLCNTRKCAK